MNLCSPLKVTNWNSWKDVSPIDPLDLLSYCAIKKGANTDVGIFVNSTDFNLPYVLPTLKITAVQVLKKNIGAPPTTLAVMTNPIGSLTVFAGDTPDLIDIYFDYPPDPLSISNASFVVTAVGIPPVPSRTTIMVSPTCARIQFAMPLGANTFNVNIHGSTAPTVTMNSINLDGEPLGLPSGDDSAGTDFTFSVIVSGTPQPTPPTQPDYGSWINDPFLLASAPTCSALGTDNDLMLANAMQWNFLHRTSVPSTTIAPPLNNLVYLRGGNLWMMTVPIQLGSLNYPDIQVSFRNNAGTRGGCQGTVPAVSFTARNYTGLIDLRVVLGRLGRYIMGIRAIDEFGNSYMYEMDWNVVP
jgi:hypothetical protein